MQNRQAIILLFIANIISGLAQGISMIAIPWYFVEVVSRPGVFASAYIIITFLTLFWGLYAGTLVDRYPRKKLFIIVNLICGILIGCIALYGFQKEYLPVNHKTRTEDWFRSQNALRTLETFLNVILF